MEILLVASKPDFNDTHLLNEGNSSFYLSSLLKDVFGLAPCRQVLPGHSFHGSFSQRRAHDGNIDMHE